MKIAVNSATLSLLAGTAFAFSPSSMSTRPLTHLPSSATLETATISVVDDERTKAPPAGTAVVDGNIVLEAPIGQGMDVALPLAEEEEDTKVDRIQPGRYSNKDNSIALPFLMRPPALDGSHAGDYGFDPLGFTEEYDLYTMQEAEIRHARLAMLAVVGWPLSELVAPEWMLQENGCAPSVLNGFNPLTFVATLTVFGAFGFLEYQTALRRANDTPMGQLHKEDMKNVWKYGVAGDYNFDPLNLYSSIGNDAYARKGLRDVEISHGRSAMLAVTAFAGWEALTGHPIVENSMFFHPNLLLPALTAGYFAFNSIYEREDSDTFVRFEVSSEGQARLENLKMSLPDTSGINTQENMDKVMDAVETVKDFVAKLNVSEKYEQAQEAYFVNVVNNKKN